MSNSNIPNKTTALALNNKISEGVDKYFSKVKSITVAGTTFTPKSLVAVLNAENDASKAVDSTRAQYEEQVVTHRAAKVSAKALRSALKAYILATYGKKAVQMLGDFGMSVPKATGKRTVETKVQAVAQAKATRDARHTMGKNQKKLIKGVVPSTATAAATPSSSAPVATPAQVAPVATPVQVAQPAQPTASH
jgi:predicted Fe-Mo cluster-binding NifX family protein